MLAEKLFSVAQAGAEAILWLLIILSVFSIGMIFERFFSLRKTRKDSEKMRSRIREALQANSIEEVQDMAKDKNTLEGRALSYGLRHINEHGNGGVEEVFNAFALSEKPLLERHLNFLATLGANAPFIGLLGTVLEIMRAINAIGGDTGNMSAVIVGIAGALTATAVGLAVAIPAAIAYNYFLRQVKSALQGIETVKELCLAYSKLKPQGT